MKVSYNWLNEYFDGKLPEVKKAAEILTMNSSEVDGVELVDGDYVLDVKILPNLAHNCLSHRGIAREFSAILGLPIKQYSRIFKSQRGYGISLIKLDVKIEDSGACRRYIGKVIEGIQIGPSPLWLKNRLEILGQRSINNLVDATNFVMLELGQPMHVFDADKIIGNLIEVKKAKAGDEIQTLDKRQVKLDENVLTISNNGVALAIAGIKGGVQAEISESTKNIVLESANFDQALIRKTAQRIKILTDASKRYENDLSPEVAEEAMDLLTKIILEIAGTPETKVGVAVDAYPAPTEKFKLSVTTEQVEKILGIKVATAEIADIFKRLNFEFTVDRDSFIVTPPVERLDLRIKEDLIEEILKVYGYDKLSDKKSEVASEKCQINKSFYYSNKIKSILSDNGFSEIYGYTFAEKGEVELANSVASERKFLRNNLTSSMADYLEFNSRYSELVEMPQIKIFEISRVFKVNDEHTNLVIGVKTPSGNKGLLKDDIVLSEITNILKLGLNISDLGTGTVNKEKNIVEFNFDELLKNLPEPTTYDIEMPVVEADMRFKKISAYPFSVRDVAVFVPEGVTQETVWSLVEKEAGSLLVKNRLFDVFTKKFPDGTAKTSYAFRLVLQSYDHTLSEEEITGVMTKITNALNNQTGWQVR
jgi:phenylalanyl-tRNA synthetase beta chain